MTTAADAAVADDDVAAGAEDEGGGAGFGADAEGALQLVGVGHDYVGFGRAADADGGVSRERFVTLERGGAL